MACIVAAGAALLYKLTYDGNDDTDPVKLENSIIIHGITMTSDTPPSDGESESDGQIIYNDAFDDSIMDNNRTRKKSRTGIARDSVNEFDRLRARDRRWHLHRYQIKKKDNLWKIATRFGVHQHIIISINKIKNPEMLKPGRYLDVPTKKGIFYKINKGDTLNRIAARHKIPVKSIVAHNRLKGQMIKPGQRIFLPDAEQRRDAFTVAVKKKKHATTSIAETVRFIWPIRGRITSGFGNRTDPLRGQRQFHCGIDISANVGTPIRAAADGRVIFSGWKEGYGNCVILRHERGFITVYAHNAKNGVEADRDVKQGDVIASSGMTGAVTGAHLHFEIRKYVNPLNPMRFLR